MLWVRIEKLGEAFTDWFKAWLKVCDIIKDRLTVNEPRAAQSKHFEQGKKDNNTHTSRNMSCPPCMKVHTKCRHMQIHAMRIHAQLSIHAAANEDTNSHTKACSTYSQSLLYRPFHVAGASFSTHQDTWSCIPCSQNVMTRADTRPAPDTV